MSKQSLLLVDGDARSLRVLEVSLRKAGFTVTPASSVEDALEKLQLDVPDLIISEIVFPEGDGFELRSRVRNSSQWSQIPFVFLTGSTAIENKIRGLELGVDDYLTKPIYIKEIVTRISILLQKRQRARLEERRDGRTRFAGRVADMPVVDVIQTIEISRKSGVIQFTGDGGRQGAIYFRDGKVIDAEADALQGEDAVYRLLTWSDGRFEVVFRTVRRREAITASSQALLMEGMRRLDEWTRLLEQLPPLSHRFEVDTHELALRLGDVPDDNNQILRLIDGKRTLHEVIDACEFGDLECVQAVSRLYFEGMLVDLDHDAPRREPSQPREVVAASEDVAFGEWNDEAQESYDSTPADDEPAGAQASAHESPRADADDAAAAADDRGHEYDHEHEHGADAEHDAPAAEEVTELAEAPVDASALHARDALLGGYRPSSLRLIDEAVAAAQAIEPSMFDEDAPGALETARRDAQARSAVMQAAAGDDDSVPHEIASDDAPGEHYDLEPEDPTPLPTALASLQRRDESGLRMIGSLGRDRAEASGELAPLNGARAASTRASQRELVTILPRRATREIPAVVAALASKHAGTMTAVALAPESEPAVDDDAAATNATVDVGDEHADQGSERVVASGEATASSPPTSMSTATPIDAHEAREPRAETERGDAAPAGPSALTMLLIALALGLAGYAIYTRVNTHAAGPAHRDAPASTPTDAPIEPAPAPTQVPADGPAAPIVVGDAAAPAVDTPSAGSSATASPTPPAPGSPAPVDRQAVAKQLMEQSSDAYKQGNPDEAIKLAKESLRYRATARTYLIEAQALQSQGSWDEALAAIDAAIALKGDYAPAWYQRGHLQWQMHHYDDGRVSLQRYLDLAPTGDDAQKARRMLSEPR